MSKLFCFLFIVLLSCLSCNSFGKYSDQENHLTNILSSNEVTIEQLDSNLFVAVEFDKDTKLKLESIASIAALTAYDTLATDIKNPPQIISLYIKTPSTSDTIRYKWGELPYFKNYVVASSNFVSNLLQQNIGDSRALLDTSFISENKLQELNAIGLQLKQEYKHNNLVFDGFLLSLEDTKVIQINANLENNSEVLPLVFQYNLNTGKLFYFGINE